MASNSSKDQMRNNQRLLSSVRSAVTSRKSCPPTPARVGKIVLRQSAKKHNVHRTTDRARSTIIIQRNIRPLSRLVSKKTNQNTDITNPVNVSNRRHDASSLVNRNSNQSKDKIAYSTNVHSNRSRDQSSSKLRINSWTNNGQRETKSSTQSIMQIHKKSKAISKRSLKLSNVVPYNDNLSWNSITFNSSSEGKIIDTQSNRKESIGQFHELTKDTKKRRRRLCYPFCPCLIGVILVCLILGILLATLLLNFLPKSSSTTIITRNTSTSSIATTTTTTQYVCGSSCVNQSWISSANLLAEWEFDNNLLEDVTNSMTSSVKSPIYTTGYVNEGLLFDLNGNQSLTSPVINVTTISFTVDAWIYPTGFSNTQEHSIVGLCPSVSVYECLHLTIHENGGNYNLFFGFLGDDCVGNTVILANEWIHVAFVFDAVSLEQSIYINGKLDVTRTAGAPFKANPDSVTIGHIPNLDVVVGPNYFQGIIDRLTISGRDKSSCEILEQATLAAYFTFNSGISMTDSGPNSLSAAGSSVSFVSTGHSFQAISFTGSVSSYFQISGVTSLGITNRPFSISFWIRPRSLSGTLVHVSANASGVGWCMPFLGFTANGSIVAQMRNGIIGSVIGPSISLAPTWTHIVETWGPTNGLRLYINNVLVASTTAIANSYTASSVPNYVTLGNSLSGAGICNSGLMGSMTPFDGDIDEFRIYSQELNAIDICTLYIT